MKSRYTAVPDYGLEFIGFNSRLAHKWYVTLKHAQHIEAEEEKKKRWRTEEERSRREKVRRRQLAYIFPKQRVLPDLTQ